MIGRRNSLFSSIPCISLLLAVLHLVIAEDAMRDHAFVEEAEAKRGPQLYSFGLGRRSWPYGVHGRENLDDEEIAQKRGPRFAFGLGKRGPEDDFDRYSFGLGKRDLQGSNRYAFGLGKRAAQRYGFGLGKRQIDESEFEDYMKRRYSFGLGKRAEDSDRSYFGHRKRAALASMESE